MAVLLLMEAVGSLCGHGLSQCFWLARLYSSSSITSDVLLDCF